jgi:hypothetical protein
MLMVVVGGVDETAAELPWPREYTTDRPRQVTFRRNLSRAANDPVARE